jgi:hypothetical protein
MIPGRDLYLERSEFARPANAALAVLAALWSAAGTVEFLRVVDGTFTGSTLVSQAFVIGYAQAIVSFVIQCRGAFQARWGPRAFAGRACPLSSIRTPEPGLASGASSPRGDEADVPRVNGARREGHGGVRIAVGEHRGRRPSDR